MANRILNLAVATLALLFLLPLAATIALGIRLTSPGPVLCRQRRAGLDGAGVEVWKFRTAREESDVTIHPGARDVDRLTPFGRFLRMASLDDLPGLLNVIDGSLSLEALLLMARDREAPGTGMPVTGVPPRRVN